MWRLDGKDISLKSEGGVKGPLEPMRAWPRVRTEQMEREKVKEAERDNLGERSDRRQWGQEVK